MKFCRIQQMCLCTFKNQLLKQTDTIARYKNLNFVKPTYCTIELYNRKIESVP
jgi:hypothetical protein